VCALSGPGAAAFAASLAAAGGLTVSEDGSRTLVVAPTHRVLCDALASVERPTAAVRVEVDPPG
jgi:hypothetical protein